MATSVYDVTIIGGGAAGLLCAIQAGHRGRRVVVLERARRAGRKILISGGGRCNFTNLNAAPDHYLSENPHFAVSALSRYTPQDFIGLVESHGIPYHEKELGQLFCDGTSQEVVDMLLRECESAGVDIVTSCDVQSAAPSDRGFSVATNQGTFASETLVMASGGLSIPQMGSTGFSHDVARQFGLQLTDMRAALVPFTFRRETAAFFTGLAGVSVRCTVRCGGAEFTHNLLCTHRGLSGPAMLQISSYWKPGQALSVDLMPDANAEELLTHAKAARPGTLLATVLAEHLPKRFAQAFSEAFLPQKTLAQFSRQDIVDAAGLLHGWPVRPDGTEGYRTAEVTLGGVDTRELSSKTMEARRVPGLFFIGECVDVTGHLGGYNFQWAWASGYSAGEWV